MILSILFGLLLTILTVFIHATGTAWWIDRIRRGSGIRTTKGHKLREFKVIYKTASLLLMLHILEVIVWGISYLAIPELEQIKDIEEAFYFSIVTFTSLGYGDIVISNDWRLISGIQSMSGLFVFGWSTALLFTVFRSLWDSADIE